MTFRKLVVFVPFIDAFGGVERLVASLIETATYAGIPHEVVCFRDSLGLSRFSGTLVNVKSLGGRRQPLLERRRLHRYLAGMSSGTRVIGFDLKAAFYLAGSRLKYAVHLTDPPSLLGTDRSQYAPSLNGGWLDAIRHRGIPLAIRAEISHHLTKRGVLAADALVVMTNAIAREVEGLYGRTPIVLRPGVKRPPETLRLRDTAGRHELRLLSVSRLEGSKRIDWLLRAIHSSAKYGELLPWVLDIVGIGPCRDALEALARGLGVGDKVVFHGRVTDAELEGFYARASAFAMPATQGYGLPALEALVRGVPVAMHRESGVSEILEGSPWVEISSAVDAAGFEHSLDRLAARIRTGKIDSVEPPAVPSDQKWSLSLLRTCGWPVSAY